MKPLSVLVLATIGWVALVAQVHATSHHFVPESTLAQDPPTTHIFAGISIGDLVKLPNDNDPTTVADSTVYYFDRDWKRHPFPSRRVYDSWYADFGSVKEITPEQMAAMRLGKNIRYRPGTRLIKIPSIPKVYAVEPGGVLRWVTSEAVASELYGADWNTQVEDVNETYFLDYTEGSPLYTAQYPTGTLLRVHEDSTLYLVEGDYLRRMTFENAIAYGYQTRWARVLDALPEGYTVTGGIDDASMKLSDAAEIAHIETLPAPQIDFPETAQSVVAGERGTLASFRITNGEPMVLKSLSVDIDGDVAPGVLSRIAIEALVTEETNDGEVTEERSLFGYRELTGEVEGAETVPFNGAHAEEASQTKMYYLRADVGADVPSGTVFTFTLQPGLGVYHGLNTERTMHLFPGRDYATLTATVE